MGAAAAAAADVVLVTSDNPRTEDPHKIIEDVVRGAAQARRLLTEPDRARRSRRPSRRRTRRTLC